MYRGSTTLYVNTVVVVVVVVVDVVVDVVVVKSGIKGIRVQMDA